MSDLPVAEHYRPRSEMKGRQIVGYLPDGSSRAATWEDYDEFRSIGLGCDVFDLAERVIGKDEATVVAETRGGFWDGVIKVEWLPVKEGA